MTNELSHLDAIDLRLSHERARVAAMMQQCLTPAKRNELTWREHNVMMIEREREAEIKFLAARGVTVDEPEACDMSIDEILAELEG